MTNSWIINTIIKNKDNLDIYCDIDNIKNHTFKKENIPLIYSRNTC